MHPYAIDWVVNGQHFRIPSYGLFLALAFTFSYLSALRRAYVLEEETKHIENLFIVIVLSAMIGARLFHVFFEEPGFYITHPEKIIAVWEGGYTLYGAMLSCIAAIFCYCRWKQISFLGFIDIASEATALGIGIGRIGCFMAGCCWGNPSDLPWAVTFTHPESFTTMKHIPLHPSQLYEAAGALLIYFYLFKKFRNREYNGQIFFHGLLTYSLLRFLIEFFRGDEYRGYVWGDIISYSQFVSLLLLPLALCGMAYFSRVHKRKHSSSLPS